VIGLALGRLVGDDSPIQFPVWYEGVAYGLTVPAAVLGGWLRRRFWGERLVATGLRAGVYPDLKQAVWLLVLFMLVTVGVSIAAGLAVAAAIRGRISLLQWVVPAIVAGAAVGYALVLAWATRKSRAPVAEIFPFKMVPVASIWPAVATIVGIAILFADLTILIRRASSIPRVPIDPTNIFGGLERGFWPAVIIIVILAPIAEELLFRGVILRGLLSHYTTRKAILVSSVLFGVSHVNPVLIAAATVLGMLFAWWRVRTGSLLLPCLGHCLNNATALAISRLPWVTDPAFMSAEAGRVFQPLWFGLAGVVLLLLGIWQFRRVAVA
ncbi:MAG TPA: type II CAAX endopeptidase family protein, partial [bacterium]|nr:type II CAAX endopeptidase family protein [bacterium]